MRFLHIWCFILATFAATPTLPKIPDPMVAARSARLAGHLDEAERLLDTIVAAKPSDYAALYNMGLVYDARAHAEQDRAKRLDLLKIAASYLERAMAHLPDSLEIEPTIFNTLGYVYIEQGDLIDAENRLTRGLKYQSRLSKESKGKLLSNLGYVRGLLGDTPGAVFYFKQGAALGNTHAIANLAQLQNDTN